MEFPPAPGPSTVRIIGIDPGTDTLGIGVIDVDIDDYSTKLVYAETLHAAKATRKQEWKREILGGADTRILSHADELLERLAILEPTVVASESPFLNYRRVTAFEALVKCFRMLREVLWNYSPSMFLRGIDPITVKNSVGVSHIGTDKTDMQKAVVALYKDKCDDDFPIGDIDEHSIDAVAVAHCVYRRHLLGDLWESTKKAKKRKPRGEKGTTRRRRRRRKKK